MVACPEDKSINPNSNFKAKKAHFKRIITEAKKVHKCPHCEAEKGIVKKLAHGSNRIIYTLPIVNQGASSSLYSSVKQSFIPISDSKPPANSSSKERPKNDLKIYEITPDSCLKIFKKLNYAHWCYLLQNANAPAPENLIVSLVQVPPRILRPSITMQHEQTNEDDLTMKLLEMIRQSNLIDAHRHQGKDPAKIGELQQLLQLLYNQLINSDSSEAKSIKNSFAQVKGVLQRLKGKQGRFRGNLSGKRVEYTARTVISPDPNLRVNQVAVPIQIAKELSFPEIVTEKNIEKLKMLVLNGPDTYPGANFVTLQSRENREGFTVSNSESDRYFLGSRNFRQKVALNLQPGDTVHRQMHSGDVVLFNRQPSLHKQSIMAFEAVVRDSPDKTLKFNECVCSPFNADFDGDEMNLHLLQNYLSKGEAIGLMDSAKNILTSKNGEATITLIQDFLTTLYTLTRKDFFLTQAQFGQLFVAATNGLQPLRLPMPTILQPRALWTGKQLFSVLLNPNPNEKLDLNLTLKEKFYDSSKNQFAFDLDDGFVIVLNGKLISGRIGKNAMGGSKNGLLYALIRTVGSEGAARTMNRFSVLSAKLIESFGISFGLRDVCSTSQIEEFNSRLFKDKIDQTQKLVDKFFEERAAKAAAERQKKLLEANGQSSSEAEDKIEDEREERAKLEIEITGLLNSARDEAGKFLTGYLQPNNNALIMALCGAKGSVLNICQMASTLGQQTVSGHRIQNVFLGRTLPHFKVNDYAPQARGFCTNSFFTGLTPTEFFFHTMAGREGLIDTAVKTADTGYMQRKLMKVLEDLVVEYDFTVRNSEKKLIQFAFGDDAFDPKDVESDDFPVKLTSCSKLLKDFKVKETNWGSLLSQAETMAFEYLLPQKYAREQPICDTYQDSLQITAENQYIVKTLFAAEFLPPLAKMYPLYRKNLKFNVTLEQVILHLQNKTRGSVITVRQIRKLIRRLLEKIMRTIVNPGEAVGAIAATSLGEPCTQMTLKTFHFAGVASMNVTLGVPRIKEIFNASEEIATPIIEIQLRNPFEGVLANFVKNKINAVYLCDILESVEEVFDRAEVCMILRFDFEVITSALVDVSSKVLSCSRQKGAFGSEVALERQARDNNQQ